MNDATRVVVTGLGINCALGHGTEHVWSAVRAGQTGIRLTERLAGLTLVILPRRRRRPRR